MILIMIIKGSKGIYTISYNKSYYEKVILITKKKVCKVCGVELNELNKYMFKKSHSVGRICKSCHKDKSRAYKKLNQSKITIVRRGKYPPFKISFKTEDERRSFRTYRKLQIRWGRPHTDSSSFVGKSVDEFIQYMDQDTRTYRQYYIDAKCNQLRNGKKCNGAIRYDKLGYKVCIECGVFHSSNREHIMELINNELNQNLDILPEYDYGMFEGTDIGDGDSTFDKFYSRAYGRKLK